MNDGVILKKVENSAAEFKFRSSAMDWLDDNLGGYKYHDAFHLHVVYEPFTDDTQTVGKPKNESVFSKAVKQFKANTGLKIGRIDTLNVWEGRDWIFYTVLAKKQFYVVVKLVDPLLALQLKLSLD
jgi:hypothetical protein